MNKIKSFIYLSLFSLVLICSCSSEDEKENMDEQTLSKTAIIEIGKLHNEYLSSAFTNFNWKSRDKFAEAQNKLMQIDIPEINLETQQRAVDFSFTNENNQRKTSNEIDLESVKLGLNSELAISLVDLAYYNLNSNEHHSDFSNSLVEIKSEIENNLTGTDFEVVYSYVIVLEQSSFFWKPVELGGSGEGYKILINSQINDTAKRGVSPCTKAVVAADGAAAATAFLGAGVAGWIAGAVNPAAMAASVAIAAAGASTYTGLTHPDCDDDEEENNQQ
tara:strand:+ start:212 stop:1039 length:828 start_codon:yes stop_codon:yes gene_type:complete